MSFDSPQYPRHSTGWLPFLALLGVATLLIAAVLGGVVFVMMRAKSRETVSSRPVMPTTRQSVVVGKTQPQPTASVAPAAPGYSGQPSHIDPNNKGRLEAYAEDEARLKTLQPDLELLPEDVRSTLVNFRAKLKTSKPISLNDAEHEFVRNHHNLFNIIDVAPVLAKWADEHDVARFASNVNTSRLDGNGLFILKVDFALQSPADAAQCIRLAEVIKTRGVDALSPAEIDFVSVRKHLFLPKK